MSPAAGPPPADEPTASGALWTAGGLAGAPLVALTGLVALALAAVNVWLVGRLSLFFDLWFVVLCVGAAFAVRSRDLFAVAVLPPALMVTTVGVLAASARTAVADPVDSMVQALVSGLVHHAGALAAGYAASLAVLAVRHAATQHASR